MVEVLIHHLQMEVLLVDLVVEDLEIMLQLRLELVVQELLVHVMDLNFGVCDEPKNKGSREVLSDIKWIDTSE